MMPVVRIPDPVFERLQSIAKPFVDTPATVIERLLDFYEGAGQAPNASAKGASPINEFDPHTPPGLAHTRRVKAQIGGLQAANWNELVQMAHRQAAKLRDIGSVKKLTRSNVVSGRKEDEGYHYISDINLSIQYVSADNAWRNALHLAENLKLEISAEFEWQEVDGAALPGKRGKLYWSPNR